MSHRLVFLGKQQVAYESFTTPAVEADQVRVQGICSLVSTGTEGIVFNRLFEPGTHWDGWVKYPFYPGYALISTVTEVGSAVTSLKVGDRVASRSGHASEAVLKADECVPVPAGLNPRTAAWFALAKIAFMGARAAKFDVGDDVLVIGAGPIGQMITRWAFARGVRNLVVIDTVQQRLDMASKGGATATVCKGLPDANDEILAAIGKKPRIVIDTTGNAKVLPNALRIARDKGVVMLLGDTGTPSAQHLTADLITRAISLIGAHDTHDDAEWNNQTISRLFFQMAVDGRFDVSGLETHVFNPADCVKAYETMSTRRAETMGVIFDWSAQATAAAAR